MLERQFSPRSPHHRHRQLGRHGQAVEIQPDPERLMRYGITLDQLQKAISESNANVGGDYLIHGENMLNVRGIGLIGEGLDPTKAEAVLDRAKSSRSWPTICGLRKNGGSSASAKTVITAVKNVPNPCRRRRRRRAGALRRRPGARGVVVGTSHGWERSATVTAHGDRDQRIA